MSIQYYRYSPDDALVVRNIYIESFLFFRSTSREKFYLQCFNFHHHPRQSNICIVYVYFNEGFIYLSFIFIIWMWGTDDSENHLMEHVPNYCGRTLCNRPKYVEYNSFLWNVNDVYCWSIYFWFKLRTLLPNLCVC